MLTNSRKKMDDFRRSYLATGHSLDITLAMKKKLERLADNLGEFIEAMEIYEIAEQRKAIAEGLASCYVTLNLIVHNFGLQNEFDTMVDTELELELELEEEPQEEVDFDTVAF